MKDGKLYQVQNEAAARLIKRHLRELEGNVAMTARRLGLTRQGLAFRMAQLGIDAADFRRKAATK